MATFVGAGDIADCGPGAAATAALLDAIGGTVFTLGDNTYPRGEAVEFANCYEPTWGRHRARTKPTPGNHDYLTDSASPYFAYFGDAAGPTGRGFYSFDLGGWHIVSLNSNVAADASSEQLAWLQSDLAASSMSCTLAYWHHPVFSTGAHGNDPKMREVWRVLYAAGADVVLNGHEHDYERFAPQTPDGGSDPTRGIREFVVGTGGVSELRGFPASSANTEVRDDSGWGVLKLTLRSGAYEWEFRPVAEAGFRDFGTAVCSP